MIDRIFLTAYTVINSQLLPLLLQVCMIADNHSQEWTMQSDTNFRERPRYCRKVYWTKMVQNGPNDHFGQNGLIPNRILAFARLKWTKIAHFGPFWPKEVHFGPFRSANRTLAIHDNFGAEFIMTISAAEIVRNYCPDCYFNRCHSI